MCRIYTHTHTHDLRVYISNGYLFNVVVFVSQKRNWERVVRWPTLYDRIYSYLFPHILGCGSAMCCWWHWGVSLSVGWSMAKKTHSALMVFESTAWSEFSTSEANRSEMQFSGRVFSSFFCIGYVLMHSFFSNQALDGNKW